MTIYLVKRMEMALRQPLDRITSDHGLTALQYTALSVLRDHPGLSAADLARRSFVSTQAASEMTLLLENSGFVVRETNESDRRSLSIALTTTGREALIACDRRVARFEEAILGGLDGDEIDTLRRAVEHCTTALRDMERA
jgi:DNA-binding MarR family transcriptional regulator